MLLPILVESKASLSSQEFMNAYEDLGIAIQLTTILQKVGEDLRNFNRIYIPDDFLKVHQISKIELKALANQPKGKSIAEQIPRPFINLWEALASITSKYYLSYENYLPLIDKETRIPLVVTVKIYQSYLDSIRKAQYNCFTKTFSISPKDRKSIHNLVTAMHK